MNVYYYYYFNIYVYLSNFLTLFVPHTLYTNKNVTLHLANRSLDTAIFRRKKNEEEIRLREIGIYVSLLIPRIFV